MVSGSSPIISAKVAVFVNKFEENFRSLDNKTLFEETKIEVGVNRKKSSVFNNKKKLSSQGSKSNLDMDRPMTDEEKKQLSRSIRNLTAPQLKGIIKIVKDMFPEKDGMLEFDIDNLPPRKCRELEDYVRRTKNLGKPISNAPKSPSKSKSLNRQNSRPQAGFPSAKGQSQGRGGSSFGPGGMNRGMMGGMHQPGLVDPNSNLMGGNKMLDESSDSESKSSNSSIESQDNLGANILHKKSHPHMPTIGGINEMPAEFAKQNSTGAISGQYMSRNMGDDDSNPMMRKYNSESHINNMSS